MKYVKPMLAVNVDLDSINYPIYADLKYDGIRALVVDGVVYSRAMKPIRSKQVQELFGKNEYEGFDGELVVGDIFHKDVFQRSTSSIMSYDKPDDVKFYVFDMWNLQDKLYCERNTTLQERLLDDTNQSIVTNVDTLRLCSSKQDVLSYLKDVEKLGGEGLIFRSLDSKYKYGRSTLKQGWLLKLKFFEQNEFEVVGFEELMHNSNEAEINELGYTQRGCSKTGMIPMDTLGSLVLKFNETTFKCGTGFDEELRKEIWLNKDRYLGKLASIRYMTVGSKILPRVPSFHGFRCIRDMG